MTGCDDVVYEVTVMVPHVYVVRAKDEADARTQVWKRRAYHIDPNTVGFPTEITVKQVEPATVAE